MNKNYTINIFIEKSRYTQFQGLNNITVKDMFGEYWDVNIFDKFDIAIVDGKLHTNIDIFFVAHHDTYNKLANYEALLGNKLIYVRQQTKSANIATYNKLLKDSLITGNFVPTSIYSINENEDPSQYCFEDGTYYVKMEYGARSLNQFIVDSTKVSLPYFITKLSQKYNEDKNVYAKSIAELVESSNGNIKHIKGNEREENEHAKYKYDYCVHRRFDDIALEARVIQSNYGANIVFLKRERNSSNDGIVDNEMYYVEEVTLEQFAELGINEVEFDKIKSQLSYAFKKNNFFHGSVDFVINKKGQWTIVETSNQFGSADVPKNIKSKILYDTIASLIDKAYN